MRQGAAQARAWSDMGEERQVAVNMSAAQIFRTDIVQEVAGVLRDTGVPARLLCVELTESLLAHSSRRVRAVLRSLKDLGLTLALDDFGTNYSSLSYLHAIAVRRSQGRSHLYSWSRKIGPCARTPPWNHRFGPWAKNAGVRGRRRNTR